MKKALRDFLRDELAAKQGGDEIRWPWLVDGWMWLLADWTFYLNRISLFEINRAGAGASIHTRIGLCCKRS